MPVPMNDPRIRGMLDAAAGAMVAPAWEVVRPAGAGDPDLASALGMRNSKTSGKDDGQEARQLDGGIMKMAMQTGPSNPLILPPEFDSVIYVIDGSGSMAGGKFERVAAVLVDAVRQMQPNQKFMVLLFNTLAIRAQGVGYREATPENVSRLAAELRTAVPVGGTDPTDALLFAIQQKPQTIVMLSDGEFEPRIVDAVTHLNFSSGLNSQINCIAIGQDVQTLRRLATQNGPGNYMITN